MSFVVIYNDMVGSTQALEFTADSWEAAKSGIFQRLRDNQLIADGVDRDSLMMFPAMIIKADNVEVKHITAYVSNDGEELCDYTESLMQVYKGPAEVEEFDEIPEVEESDAS